MATRLSHTLSACMLRVDAAKYRTKSAFSGMAVFSTFAAGDRGGKYVIGGRKQVEKKHLHNFSIDFDDIFRDFSGFWPK